VHLFTLIDSMIAAQRAEKMGASSMMAASKPLSIPKGKGRRGEGLRSVSRSCAPAFSERWSEVDGEMLSASHDEHRSHSSSLSECAFHLEIESEEAGTSPEATRPTLPEEDGRGGDGTSPSPTDVTDWSNEVQAGKPSTPGATNLTRVIWQYHASATALLFPRRKEAGHAAAERMLAQQALGTT